RGAAPLAEEAVGRQPAEVALEEHVICGVQAVGERTVDAVGSLAGPTGVRDAVLVPDDGCAAPAGERDQGPRVVRPRARAEVEDGEPAFIVREGLGETRELHEPAVRGLVAAGHPVAPVVDVDAGYRPGRRDARPAERVARAAGGDAGGGRDTGHGRATNPSRSSCQRGVSASYEFASAVRRAASRSGPRSIPPWIRSTQPASPSASSTSTTKPFSPFRTSSAACPTRVVTSGTPLAIDSSTALGPPSCREATRQTSSAR